MLKIVKKPAAPVEDTKKASDAGEGVAMNKSAGKVAAGELKSFDPIPPMCVVSITVGYSHKLANDDWIKSDIRLDVPAKYEDIDKVFDYVKEWTDAKLNAFVSEVTSG